MLKKDRSSRASKRKIPPAPSFRGMSASLLAPSPLCFSLVGLVYVSHQQVTAVSKVPVSPPCLEQRSSTKIKQASVLYLQPVFSSLMLSDGHLTHARSILRSDFCPFAKFTLKSKYSIVGRRIMSGLFSF